VLVASLFAFNAVSCRQTSANPVTMSALNDSGAPATLEMPANTEQRRLLVSKDPLAYLKACRESYDQSIQDYRCRFIKQERIDNKWGLEQHIDIRFREKPFSVDMTWVKNPGRAARVNYVKGRHAADGKEMLVAYPAGVLGLLVPNGVKRDINGEAALASSRKPIDRFGFKNSLDLIIKFCEQAENDPAFRLQYNGIEFFHNRRCFVIERLLPYDGERGAYPDRLLRIFMDCEWSVPIGVYAFADDGGFEPIGTYLLLDATFNVGLTDADFY
jgi:hypothetical protein